MPCQTYLWTPERKAEVVAVLRASHTRNEAASKLKVSAASLDHALRVYGLKGQRILLGQQTIVAPYRAPLEVKPEDAPWQGYRPKPGASALKHPAVPVKTGKATPTVTVVIADTHVPYHDTLAWSCALGLIRSIQPDRVVINGDFLDLESLSRHPKSSPDLAKLAAEFYAGNLALDELQAASGSADVVLIEGNHEARARRFEAEFGQLDGVLSVPVGLYIEAREAYRKDSTNLRGIRWVPLRMQPFPIGLVSYLHGVYESIHHSYQHAMHLGPRCSTRYLVSAHMHALQVYTSPSGHTAVACPWLGDLSAQVFTYTKGRPRPWSHGVLVIEESDPSVSISPVEIRGGRAVYGGKIVRAA
jgi:hypothetical protein